MVTIPTFSRRLGLASGGEVRSTPADFGGGLSIASQRVGALLTTFADKKRKEETDLYVSKTMSEARTKFTRRRLDLRNELEGGISEALGAEMDEHLNTAIENAPFDEAAVKVQLGLDTMNATMMSKAIVGDEISRTTKLIINFDENHQNNRNSVYDDFSSLQPVLDAEERQINELNISSADKKIKLAKTREDLSFDAFEGLVDGSNRGAHKALKILELNNVEKNKELKWLNKGHRQKLIKYAESAIRTHGVEEDKKLAREERQRVIRMRNEENVLLNRHVDSINDDGDGITMKDIAKSKLDSTRKIWLQEVLRNEDRFVDPSEQASTFTLLLSDVDTISSEAKRVELSEVIRSQMTGRVLNLTQGMQLLNRLEEPVTQARKLMEKMLQGSLTDTSELTGVKDPEGDRRYQQAWQDIEVAVKEKKNAGEPTAPLFNPESDEYIGDTLVDKYWRSGTERAIAQFERLRLSKKRKREGEEPKGVTDQELIKSIVDKVLKKLTE